MKNILRFTLTLLTGLFLNHQGIAQAGAALNFNGSNNYVNIPDNSLLDFGTGDFSVEASIQTSVSQSGYAGIVAKGGGWPGYQLVIVNNRIAMEITDNSSFLGTANGLLGTTVLNDGVWHHLAAVVNRSTHSIQLFVDGNVEATVTDPNISGLNVNNVNVSMSIGAERTLSSYFKGNIDEVRLWNRALPQCELQNHMNCEIAATATGLVANYHFNEGTASANNSGINILTDVSGNTLNGTLTNFSLTGTASNWITPGTVVSGTSCSSPAPTLTSCSPTFALPGTTVTITGTDLSGTTAVSFGGVPAASFTVLSSTSISAVVGGGTSGTITVNTCDGAGTLTGFTSSGAALNFDGTANNFVDLGTSLTSVFNTLHTITVEAWLYPTSTSGNGLICGNYITNTNNGQMQFLLRRDGNSYTFWVDCGAGFQPVSSPGGSVVLNAWQHLAGVWDGSNLYLYINGVLQNTTNGVTGATFLNSNNNVYIGSNANNESYTGSIDEVRIWNRALCQSEITNNMNCEAPGNTTGLLANYHFNEGIASGSNPAVTTLSDASGNGNDGTLNNFALTMSASNWIAPGAVLAGSSCATFTIPSITSNASDQSACSGGNASFTVAATGMGIAYQWQENTGSGFSNINNGGIYSNATTATLTLTGVTSILDGNTYQCIISTCGPVISATATLHVGGSITQPANTTVCLGSNGLISFIQGGTGNIFQWQVNTGSGFTNVSDGGVYAGASTSTLLLIAPGLNMNGYSYICQISGTCGTSSSNTVTLTVNPSPAISISGTTSLCAGTPTTLTANGGDTYFWGEQLPPLDRVSSCQFAVGLRKLKSAYSGHALRLRRASDNMESNFGFIGADLDIASITAFLGGSSGFCTTLYDQSGSGNNMTETTQSQQPLFVSNGLNGKPVLSMSAASVQTMTTYTNFPAPFTVVYGAVQTGPGTGRLLNSINDNWLLGWWGGAKDQAYYEGWVSPAGSPGTDANPTIYTGTSDGSSISTIYSNGNLIASNGGGITGPNGLCLNGYANGNSEMSDGKFTEAYVFNTVLSTADRQTVENSTGQYYSIPTSLATTATNIITPLSTTTVYVTGTNTTTGCAVTASQLITVTPIPSSTILGVTNICSGNATTLSATGTGNYTWTPGGSTATSLTTNTAGTYSLTVSTGTCTTSSTTTVTVNNNSASLNFDAGSGTYVDLGNGLASVLNNLNTITVEAWVYPTTTAGNGVICGNYATPPNTGDMQFLLRRDGSNYSFWVNAGSGFQSVYSGNPVTLNTWQHVSGVWDGTQLMIYVNGVLQGTSTGVIGTRFNQMTNNVYIGNDNGEGFTGNLDEIRIWNYARTQTQIQGAMNQTLNSVAQTGLLAYYIMNDGIPNADNTALPYLSDGSGNNNNGTFSNFNLIGNTVNFAGDFQTITITGPSSLCAGVSGNFSVTGIGASSYLWTPNGATTSPALISSTTPATVSVVTTDNSGCTQSTSQSLSISPLPVDQAVTATTTSFCGKDSTVITVAGSEPGVTYSLYNQTSASIVGCTQTGNGSPLSFNTGALTATTTFQVNARLIQNGTGTGLNFNGSSMLAPAGTLTNIPVNNSNYTLEAWIKPTVGGTNGIVGWGEYGNGNQVNAFRLNGSNQLINYWWGNDLTVNTPTLTDGNWHHVAATYDGSTRSIFVDGIFMGADNPGANSTPDVNNFAIGQTLSGEFFVGSMDEVRIWNVARSQADLVANMNNCLIGTETGLVADYKMEDGSGSPVASDATCNRNTLTLTGMDNVNDWVAGSFSCAASCTTILTATPTITINPIPTATVTNTDVNCFGGSDGSVTAAASGGTTNYTYSWNSAPVQTTAMASGLPIGTYTCSILDASGCATSITASINQPAAAFTSSLSAQTDLLCFGTALGSASITASGGTTNYTYSWNSSPAQTTATASGLTSGTYTCFMQDANGCTSATSVSIMAPPAISSSVLSQTNVSCNSGNNGATAITASGGTGSLMYTWSPSGGTATTLSGLVAGNYTCTITDANSCNTTQVVNITEPAVLSGVVNTQTNATCNGSSDGSATVTTNGGTISYTYSWNTTPAQTVANATTLSAGTYTCVVTDANACSTTVTAVITDPAALVVNISSVGSVLTASTTGVVYQWYLNGTILTGATAQNYTATATGNYTVVVTDGTNCSATSATYPFTATEIGSQGKTGILELYPNPAIGNITLEINSTGDHTELYLYDVLGQQVRAQVLTSTTNTIEREGLAEGIYSYRVIRDHVMIGTGKLVIQK